MQYVLLKWEVYNWKTGVILFVNVVFNCFGWFKTTMLSVIFYKFGFFSIFVSEQLKVFLQTCTISWFKKHTIARDFFGLRILVACILPIPKTYGCYVDFTFWFKKQLRFLDLFVWSYNLKFNAENPRSIQLS